MLTVNFEAWHRDVNDAFFDNVDLNLGTNGDGLKNFDGGSKGDGGTRSNNHRKWFQS